MAEPHLPDSPQTLKFSCPQDIDDHGLHALKLHKAMDGILNSLNTATRHVTFS